MTHGMQLLVYPVKDIAQAKTFYSTLLGIAPYVDSPYYVGFRVGDQEIGLDPNGHSAGMVGPLNYCEVDDIQASLEACLAAGATAQQVVKDVGDGNLIGLMQSPK